MLNIILQLSKKAKIAIICVGFLLPLIRFNGNTRLVKQTPYDQKYFTAYTYYFKGVTTETPIKPMTNWRFLLPLCASLLPFNPPTSLNLINYLAFIVAGLVLVQTIKKISNNRHAQFLGLLSWLYAFPAFYYTCIGYADIFCIMFISVGVYAVINNNFYILTVAFIAGFLTKETAILLLPFFVFFNFKQLTIKNLAIKASFLLVMAIVLRWLIKHYAPVTEGYTNNTFWVISFDSFVNNLLRFNTWFASLITFLPLVLYVWLNYVNLPKNFKLAIIAAAVSALFLWFYSFITTVADGRIFWHIYPMVLVSWAFMPLSNNAHNIR
jgi:Gpi18-like mannosyltransferase